MFENYFKVAFRNLRRRPGYTGINVFGLAIGMACCLLILTFARSEWSFDRFHEDADSIYRVNIRAVTPGDDIEIKAGQPLPLAGRLVQDFDEVMAATSVMLDGSVQVQIGTESLQQRVAYADPSFFDVFSFDLLHGDPDRALEAPGTVVLTRESAERLFGRADVMGEAVRVRLGDSFEDFLVSGVAREIPGNSSIQFDLLFPTRESGWYERQADSWTSWVSNTFFRLEPGAGLAAISSRLPAFAQQHYAPMIRTWQILQWIGPDEGDFGLELQPFTSIHFTPDVLEAQTPVTDPRYPGFLLGLAIAVLLIASINFTTLSVGRAARRAREVGMRKVLGAARWQLMRQFWGEALLMSTLALLLGVALAELLMPSFSSLVGAPLTLAYGQETLLLLGGLLLATALLAGAYPAAFLSGFGPAQVLKGQSPAGGRNRWMQGLVVLQFTLSIGFIMSVLLVSDQLQFMQTADLGFDDESVLVVETMTTDPDEADRLVETLKSRWTGIAGVVDVAASSSGFNRHLSWGAFGSADGEAHTIYTNRIDREYLRVLGLRIETGRGFTPDFPSNDTTHVLVNQALVREFGWEDPIGQPVNNYGQVAGVLEDFHFQSLHSSVEPMLLSLSSRGNDPYRYLYVRTSGSEVAPLIAALQQEWKQIAPEKPFSWSFLEDDMNASYAAERRAQRLVAAAAIFAVVIACLGLFGLAAYAAERRTREIGIRKVVGAGTISIVRLLSMDFVKLVAFAVVLAVPPSWILIERWLDGFAYRIEPGVEAPLLAACLSLVVALATVAVHAYRAAISDPVKALRSE